VPGEPNHRQVVVLAPLPLELEAVVVAFGLGGAATGEPVGTVGDSEVTAVLCGMGPAAARAATTRRFEEADLGGRRIDHVMVVGICGGLRDDHPVGTLLNPDRVVLQATGATYRHRPPGTGPRDGTLVTTEEVLLDPSLTRRMVDAGAWAVDMESAAVAEVCEDRRCRWSVYRCISDRVADGLLDDRVLALTHPDGSVDGEAVTRLLAEEPELAARLERLGRDTQVAATRAAEAAYRGCLALDA
jgi:nucleoside phosphorylase